MEAEAPENPDAPLFICDGPCNRAFHLPCVGVHVVPGEDEDWVCADCVAKKHACSICLEVGVDGDLSEGVIACSKKRCGRFYHMSCVQQADNTIMKDDVNGVFHCPAHRCWTCQGNVVVGKDGNSHDANFQAKKGQLYTCLYCPISYHVDCICPGSR